MLDPVTLSAIFKGAEVGLGALGSVLGGGQTAETRLARRGQEMSEDELFLALIQDRLDRQRANKLQETLLQTTTPIGRHFAATGLALSQGGLAEFNRSQTAPPTYATTDAQGNQAVSLQGPGEDAATPEQLSQLAAPSFDSFYQAAQKAMQESGFTAEGLNVQQGSAMDEPITRRKKGQPNTELTRMIEEFQRRENGAANR